MTTVLVGMTWAGERGKLREYLNARDGEDGILEVWFAAAVEACHEFIGRRDFTAPAIATTEWVAGVGQTEAPSDEVLASLDIPNTVRLGVYEYVRTARLMARRTPGVVSEGNGAAQESRDLWSARHHGEVPLMAARGYWAPHLLNATLAGGVPKL